MANHFPIWAATLGGALDAGCTFQVACDRCGRYAEIDVAALIEKVGRDYSLIDRRCRCRFSKRCRGWNRFYYRSGVYRPLWTDAALRRWDGW